MQFIIHKPGLLSTIQDLGRMQYPAQAIPVSGAMDPLAARIANKAAGNEDTAALIEFTYGNAELAAITPSLVAFSGSGCSLFADGRELPANRPVYLPAGTSLQLHNSHQGSRTYLAVAGGWNVPEVLQSRSTYLPASFGGLEGRALRTNDLLANTGMLSDLSEVMLRKLAGDHVSYPAWSIASGLMLPPDRTTIRVIPGREEGWFKDAAFYSASYTLSNKSNRIGYYLEGPLAERLHTRELLSTAVAPGTIQITGSGGPVLLMADCQTTGGYPRIAQVAAADMPLCGQLKPGDKIRFKKITLDEAERLYFEQEKQLLEISEAIRLRYS